MNITRPRMVSRNLSNYKPASSPSPFVGAIVCGGLGLVLLAFSFSGFREARAAAAWPVANGRLDGCAIATHVSRGRRSSSTDYSVEATYHFDALGKTWTGNQFNITRDRYEFRSSAENVWSRYHAGDPCEVHYDPADPSRSCLQTNAGSSAWWPFWLGLVFAAIGSGCLARVFLDPQH